MADRDAPGLDQVAALVRAAASARPSASVRAAGRARLLESAGRLHSVARERRSGLPAGRLNVAAALAALLAIAVFGFRYTRPLTYEVRGNANPVSDYVCAPTAARAAVSFSDGTEVTAAPGARLRIEETKRTGARVLIERGATMAQVRHRSDSSWFFVAGPFEVHVTGTRLGIVWDPEHEHIDVTLYEGSVEIETPIGPSRYAVTAGHRFQASVRDGTVKLDDATREPAEPAVVAQPAAAPALPAPEEHSPSSATSTKRAQAKDPVPAAPPAESWSQLVRKGAFQDVVTLAEARGVSSCLATCSPADLRALADAARYSGSPAVARDALLALRSRLPGKPDGVAAAFLLGRVAEAGGDLGAAERWYSTYRTEAPAGEFSSDALAGGMRVAARRGNGAGARTLAAEYLSRYPAGAAAAAARKLAGPP
jgi:hypothetical protein